ncbi:hypothetical protein JCM8097_008502 [Rhodosporidiobolus ruineniae]
MLDTLSTLIRSRYSTSHDNPTARACAAAELCALALLTSRLGSLKAHTRKEAKDEHEHMQCVTYGASSTLPAPSPP